MEKFFWDITPSKASLLNVINKQMRSVEVAAITNDFNFLVSKFNIFGHLHGTI